MVGLAVILMTAGGAIATRVPFMTAGGAVGTTASFIAVIWFAAVIVPMRLSASMFIAATIAAVAVVAVGRRTDIGCNIGCSGVGCSSDKSFGLLAATEGTLTLIEHLDGLTEFRLVCPDSGYNVIVLVWESFNELLGETAVCKSLFHDVC